MPSQPPSVLPSLPMPGSLPDAPATKSVIDTPQLWEMYGKLQDEYLKKQKRYGHSFVDNVNIDLLAIVRPLVYVVYARRLKWKPWRWRLITLKMQSKSSMYFFFFRFPLLFELNRITNGQMNERVFIKLSTTLEAVLSLQRRREMMNMHSCCLYGNHRWNTNPNICPFICPY